MKPFAGIPKEFALEKTAKTVLIQVPYDGTSTYGKGADLGPKALLDASENMELYDIETDSEVYKTGVFISEPILEDESPEKMCESVEKVTKKYIESGKFISLLGGEHSISIGAIKAIKKKYNDITILQLDAHSDLRPTYLGSECNHACALHWASQNTNLVQV